MGTRPGATPLTESRPPAVPAMASPWIDGLCIGGASILLVGFFLASGITIPAQKTGLMALVDFLLNAPHFMVSYLVLYGVARRARDYPTVSKYVPITLGFYIAFALLMYNTDTIYLEAVVALGAVLLGWHYTGQAWGYTASYSYLQGIHFDFVEKKLIRTNLRVLMGWHVVWAVVVARDYFSTLGAESRLLVPLSDAHLAVIYEWATTLATFSSLLGIAGMVRLARRTGRRPTARMLIPWIAVHAWYVLMYFETGALFLAQNAHALQYLLFLMRVEANRKGRARLAQNKKRRRGMPVASYVVLYYFALVLLGILALGFIPDLVSFGVMRLSGTTLPLSLAVVAFVNIHHYCIDNFIWKIRNPIVREDLFWHLHPKVAAQGTSPRKGGAS